jgi:organic hydroperoxide reductase OsmC/OhrA
MIITATVRSAGIAHDVRVQTNDTERELSIPARANGRGSSVNGGELLMLALATCYCNDLYREAERRGIAIRSVGVEATATFGAEGEAASRVTYAAQIDADADEPAIRDLAEATDRLAEVHNTLRRGIAVTLAGVHCGPL